MAYPTEIKHSKLYPYTSVMASPYSCDNTGVIDIAASIELIKANQSNVGTIYFPHGTYKLATNLTIPATMAIVREAGAQISIATGITLTIQCSIQGPQTQFFVLNGTGVVNISPLSGMDIEGFWFSSLAAAITAIGATVCTLHVPGGTWVVSTDLTVPTTCKLRCDKGTNIQIATTKTLTINGPVEAGLYQIFDCVGTGQAVFGSGAVDRVNTIWFGTNALAKTCASLADGMTLVVNPGAYTTTTTITMSRNCDIDWQDGATLACSGAGLLPYNTPAFSVTGNRVDSYITISNIANSNREATITISGQLSDDPSTYAGKYLVIYSNTEINVNNRTSAYTDANNVANKVDMVYIRSASYSAPNTILKTDMLEHRSAYYQPDIGDNSYTLFGLANITAHIVEPLKSITIKGVNITGDVNTFCPMILTYVVDSQIVDYKVKNYYGHGIKTLWCARNKFSQIEVRDPLGDLTGGNGYGLTFSCSSHYNVVEDSIFVGCRHGIDCEYGSSYNKIIRDHVEITNGTYYSNSSFGIMLGHAGGKEWYNEALDNTIVGCLGGIMSDYPARGSKILRNNVLNSVQTAIYIQGGDRNTVVQNNKAQSAADGILLRGCQYTKVNYNDIKADKAGLSNGDMRVPDIVGGATVTPTANDLRFNSFDWFLNTGAVSATHYSMAYDTADPEWSVVTNAFSSPDTKHLISDLEVVEFEVDLSTITSTEATNPVVAFFNHAVLYYDAEVYLDGNVTTPGSIDVQFKTYMLSGGTFTSKSYMLWAASVASVPKSNALFFDTTKKYYLISGACIKPFINSGAASTGIVRVRMRFMAWPSNAYLPTL